MVSFFLQLQRMELTDMIEQIFAVLCEWIINISGFREMFRLHVFSFVPSLASNPFRS